MISTLKNDEFYIGPQSSLDQLLTVMRTRITELQECHKRVRFYVNEIKLNQNNPNKEPIDLKFRGISGIFTILEKVLRWWNGRHATLRA